MLGHSCTICTLITLSSGPAVKFFQFQTFDANIFGYLRNNNTHSPAPQPCKRALSLRSETVRNRNWSMGLKTKIKTMENTTMQITDLSYQHSCKTCQFSIWNYNDVLKFVAICFLLEFVLNLCKNLLKKTNHPKSEFTVTCFINHYYQWKSILVQCLLIVAVMARRSIWAKSFRQVT